MADEFENLENLLMPFCYSPETPLPADIPGRPSVSRGIHYRGCLSQDCEFGWMYNKSIIQCFPVDCRMEEGPNQNQKLLTEPPKAVTVDPYQFDDGFFITCSAELALHNQRTSKSSNKLLLGIHKVRKGRGALAIFDPAIGKPIKMISLPSPVTSVTVLSHFEDGGSNRPFFNDAMMAMVGIAAVGMEGGMVLIIDLGLDQFTHLEFYPGPSDEINSSFSHNPKRPFYSMMVDPHEPLIATKRHNAQGDNKLITLKVLYVPEGLDELDRNFHYCKPDGEAVASFPFNLVKVSCIEYIPAIGSLVIGFSFGGFQIWRTDSLALIFSSNISNPEEANSIFGFSFSQPIDDPKNYCYLWVMYGKPGIELGNCCIELHCLAFNEKPYVDNFGHTYDDLKKCVKRLTIRLEDFFADGNLEDPNEEQEGLATATDVRYNVRPLKIWNDQKHNLTLFSWESQRIGIYYIGIFDLNQWYSSRTLDFIRTNPDNGLCPYWVAIPVETSDALVTNLWDVQIIPKTLFRWDNPHSKLDILHLYPASLSFQGAALTETGVSIFQHFGIQEKLIRILLRDGPALLIKPAKIRKFMKMYGITPVFAHEYDERLTREEADRYYILSALLECRRQHVITTLASAWVDGSYAKWGCTVDLIIGWICAYTTAIRFKATEHWEDVLGLPNDCLPPETAHFLNYSNYTWKALHGLLIILTRPDEVYLGRENYIEELLYALNHLVQYSASILMLYKAGILPKKMEAESDMIAILTADHERRRAGAEEAIRKCDALDDTLKKGVKPMMIDYLLEAFDEEFLREQWNLEEDEAMYPPKDIGYILNMFLWDEDPKDVARLVAYFLLDVREHLNEENELRGDFSSVMLLDKNEEADVFHLWLLDHGYPQKLILHLLERSCFQTSGDKLPWSAAIAVSAALDVDEDVIIVLKKQCPPQLLQLYINLQAKTPAGYGELCESVCKRDFIRNKNALYRFFKVSDDLGKLGDFITAKIRSAPPEIIEALVNYLKENSSFENDDRLLGIYSHFEDEKNISEQVNKMNRIYEGKLTDQQRSRWTIRQALIKRILSSKRGSSFMNRISGYSSSPVIPYHNKAPVRIRAEKAPLTPPSSIENSEGEEFINNLPPHLKRLKHLKSKPADPLSPLRRYAGKLESFMKTPRKSMSFHVMRRESSSRKSFTTSKLSKSNLSINMSKFPADIEEVAEDEEEEEMEEGEVLEGQKKNKNEKSFAGNLTGLGAIDLEILLQPPCVDHRLDRSSMSASVLSGTPVASQANKSIFKTPCASSSNNTEVHSIMKKEDSICNRRKTMELRFVDVPAEIETVDEEMEGGEKNTSGTSQQSEGTGLNIAVILDASSQSQDMSFASCEGGSNNDDQIVTSDNSLMTDDADDEFSARNTSSAEEAFSTPRPTRSASKLLPTIQEMVETPRTSGRKRKSPEKTPHFLEKEVAAELSETVNDLNKSEEEDAEELFQQSVVGPPRVSTRRETRSHRAVSIPKEIPEEGTKPEKRMRSRSKTKSPVKEAITPSELESSAEELFQQSMLPTTKRVTIRNQESEEKKIPSIQEMVESPTLIKLRNKLKTSSRSPSVERKISPEESVIASASKESRVEETDYSVDEIMETPIQKPSSPRGRRKTPSKTGSRGTTPEVEKSSEVVAAAADGELFEQSIVNTRTKSPEKLSTIQEIVEKHSSTERTVRRCTSETPEKVTTIEKIVESRRSTERRVILSEPERSPVISEKMPTLEEAEASDIGESYQISLCASGVFDESSAFSQVPETLATTTVEETVAEPKSVEKSARNKRKTPEKSKDLEVETPESTGKRPRTTRSKQNTPEKPATITEMVEKSDSARVTRSQHNTPEKPVEIIKESSPEKVVKIRRPSSRQRSKTPERLESVVSKSAETTPEKSQAVTEESTRRVTRSQSKRNEFDESICESDVSILDASIVAEPVVEPPRRIRRASRSKTPPRDPLPPVEEDEVLELPAEPVGTKRKTKSKTPSPTKSDVSDAGSSKSQPSRVLRATRSRRKVFDFAPELSTLLEEPSMMETTIIEEVERESKPKSRTRSRNNSAASVTSVDESETESKPKKRGRKPSAKWTRSQSHDLDETLLDIDEPEVDVKPDVKPRKRSRKVSAKEEEEATETIVELQHDDIKSEEAKPRKRRKSVSVSVKEEVDAANLDLAFMDESDSKSEVSTKSNKSTRSAAGSRNTARRGRPRRRTTSEPV